MTKNISFKVKTEVTLTHKRVEDLLVSAFEGGSNYWYYITDRKPANKSVYVCPFEEGGYLKIVDKHDKKKEYTLDLKSIQNGLQTMSNLYPSHFKDFVDEHDDAITADIFLQCCLFGEIVFG